MAPRPRDVVVIGASAGGVEALRSVVSRLPADLKACVLVVLHMPTGGTSALPEILNRVGPMRTAAARDGEELEHGRIYVARPDHHLLVADGTVILTHGPTENGHRPAINALFRSAAIARGASVTGVLLSGLLDDGAAGLHAIAGRGGRVVVQDPADALYPGMPEHAIRSLTPDHVVPVAEMGDLLAKLVVEEGDTPDGGPSELLRWENDIARTRRLEGTEEVGTPSGFACPDCNGTLVDIGDERFRCRIGHAWTAEALLAVQGSALERAMWTALRTLEEKVALTTRLAERARDRGSAHVADRYELQTQETSEAAKVLRMQVAARDWMKHVSGDA